MTGRIWIGTVNITSLYVGKIERQILLVLFICRDWFVHDIPWTIKIKGRDLWTDFVVPGAITMETFDAIIRLLQEQDTLMYKDANCNHRQCRHILPPSFVVSGNFNFSSYDVATLTEIRMS